MAEPLSWERAQNRSIRFLEANEDETGQLRTVAVDADGNEVFAAPSNATSSSLEKSRIIKASAGTLYGLSGFNSAAYAQYIQLHDSATLPADGAIPKIVFQVVAASSFSADWGLRGRAFTSGIVVCTSSTLATKTLGANNDAWFDAQYV